nr:hypothetical protein [Tanacetum cinerariifolium]
MAMAITGIEDRKYWNWVPTKESRFNIAAYLQQIWWFDGLLIFPFPADIYTLSFRIHLEESPKGILKRIEEEEGCLTKSHGGVLFVVVGKCNSVWRLLWKMPS